jgi:hypothetical protein
MDTIIKHINKTAGLVLLAVLGICATVKAGYKRYYKAG